MSAESSHAAAVVCDRTLISKEATASKLEVRVTLLFDELRAPVYRYLLGIGVSSSEAEDIVQETFLRLYRHLSASGNEDNLHGWVFRVAHNICLNEIKRKRHAVDLAPEQWAELSDKTGFVPALEEELLRKERIAWAHAAVSTLSEQQRQCLYLRAEGFRYREISEILGVTVSTVSESLRRAIRKLARGSHA